MKKSLIASVVFFIIFSMFNFYLLIHFFPDVKVIGSVTTTALVGFIIEGEVKTITIFSPENTTYNFGVDDPYTIDLNVSANFGVDNWHYTLWDLKHDELINDSVFTPNTTFNAVRWQNRIFVSANSSSDGTLTTEYVTFFVYVPNSAPSLGSINSSIYVCEGGSLNYAFNATDVDEQFITMDISPKNPFYVNPTSFVGKVYMNSNIISGVLNKDDAGGINNGSKVYEETVSVSDGEKVDTTDTNITVIEINNEPVADNVGVQTIWTKGENSTFYKQVQVTDVEDGDQDSGDFNFNISFSGEDLFNISSYGVMNFTPNISHIGVHNITVCVNDTGIDNPDENISAECGQDGSSITVCQDFSLTVTDENRVPTITDYYPDNLNLSVSGTDSLYFNITGYDPDGTIPDAYWYVDGVFQEYDSGSSLDEFTYTFGCGVSGTSTIKAEITDGLLNDSIEWSIDVSFVECPIPTPTAPSGGGVGKACFPKWVCDDWKVCQNAEKSLELGILSGDNYRNISAQCEENNLDEIICGFQPRYCFDVNNCSSSLNKPAEVQFCHYVEEPSCYDRLKNCHDDSCELLVDCGGPCDPCPTCSDGIQNQGEEGIDCGGPCPWKCKIGKPLLKRAWFLYTLLIIVILLLLIAIIMIIKISKIREFLRSKR